jgi:hypothetical protein
VSKASPQHHVIQPSHLQQLHAIALAVLEQLVDHRTAALGELLKRVQLTGRLRARGATHHTAAATATTASRRRAAAPFVCVTTAQNDTARACDRHRCVND